MTVGRATDPERWGRVGLLLDLVVAQDPACLAEAARVRDVVETLDTLAALAPGALAGAPWDAQIFQTILQRWTGSALDPRRVAELVRGERRRPRVAPDSRLLARSAIVSIGLAALRVGEPALLGREYLAAIFGVALAAGRAEALARIYSSPGWERAAARAQLLGQRERDNDLPVIQALSDADERARWLELVDLFGDLEAESAALSEDPLTEPDERVPPAWTGIDPRLTLSELEEELRPGDHVIETDPGRWPAAHKVVAIFASPPGMEDEHRVVRAVRGAVRKGRGVAVVNVPAGLRPGWIGLSSTQLVDATNRGRAELRERLSRRWITAAQASAVLPDLSLEDSLPPWPLSRPFQGGVPEVVWAELDLDARAPRVRWATRGADAVRISGVTDPLPACGATALPDLDLILIEPTRRSGAGTTCGRPTKLERWRAGVHR